MTTKIYLSGPITGYDMEERRKTFDAAAALIADMGMKAVNPMDGYVEGMDWEECMREDIAKLVRCDGIAMLPGWEDSKGARLEFDIAMALGMGYIQINAEGGAE